MKSLTMIFLLLASGAEAFHRSKAASSANTKAQPDDQKEFRQKVRGGYSTPNRPRRSRIRALFSAGTALAPPPSKGGLQQQQQGRWSRAPPPPTVDSDAIDIDEELSRLFEQQRQKSPATYAKILKLQVVKTTRQAEKTQQQQRQSALAKDATALSTLDMALFGTYFCNALAFTLPVVLLPLVAAERVAGTALSASAFVAAVASISTLGSGMGKLLNGFVCQFLGGTRSSFIYLLGVASALTSLSICNPAQAGWILAMMEFFSSIQWTACSVVLANHYKDPAKFAKGITILSLGTTSGQIGAKLLGTTLLKCGMSWRSVAQLAGCVALMAAAIMKFFITEHPAEATATSVRQPLAANEQPQQSIAQSIKAVLGSPLFWQVGIGHAIAMVARTSEKILGAFFHQATALPRSLCGGLTAFVTIGFVHGLVNGRKFHTLPDIPSKTNMLTKAYAMSAFTAAAMALCSNAWVQALFFPSQKVLAGTVAILTGILASNISFQFYQLPAMVATTFGQNKALCLSLLDAVGYLSAALVWAITGKIVAGAGQHGWTLAWLMLAGMFVACGKSMMSALPGVLMQQQLQQRV